MICVLTDSPIDVLKLTESIKAHEGTVLHAYDDANGQPIVKGYTVVGNPTIGIGRLITKDRGLTDAEAQQLLGNDIAISIAEAEAQSWWRLAEPYEPRARAFCELIYNLGIGTFNRFPKAVEAANRSDWKACADEFRSSSWFYEVGAQPGERGYVIAYMIQFGEDYAPDGRTAY